MLKIVGSLMVILSSTGIGYLLSMQLSSRQKELKTVERMMMLLKGEISYGKSTLPEALSHIGQRVDEPFAGFLTTLSQKANAFEGKSFDQLFKECVDSELVKSNLTKRDKEGLKEVGQYLGYLDMKMQVSTLELYLRELELSIQEIGDTILTKKKLYQSLGVMCGLFLAIALA